ncbi:MAG: S8 family serine peptidase [Planctomycetota bacterium]
MRASVSIFVACGLACGVVAQPSLVESGSSANKPGAPTLTGASSPYDLSGSRPLDADASFGDLVAIGPATSPFDGPSISALTGADRLYAEGYTGLGSVVAIIEAFAPSGTHNTMQHVGTVLTQDGTPVLASSHPTYTSFVATGRDTPGDVVETGMAPGSTLWGGQLAVQGPTGLFTSDQLSFRTYIDAAITGRQTGGQTADVINMSFGFNNDGRTGFINDVMIDAVVEASGVIATASAGNRGETDGFVTSPGLGFNSIAVGATGPSPDFAGRAVFSSAGPSTLAVPGSSIEFGNYASVDLVAPGQDIIVPNPSVPDSYQLASGTSFSAPTVGGGAALLVEAARDQLASDVAESATHGRTIRSVLMNSATKLNGWDNGQFIDDGTLVDAGAIVTTQGLDWEQGAGELNLDAAYDQLLGGTTDLAGSNGGVVDVLGWDIGSVENGAEQFYAFGEQLAGGSELTITLSWFAEFDADFTFGTESVSDDRFADLDLFVYELDATGEIIGTLAASISSVNETEHLTFTLADDTFVGFGVLGFGELWDFGADTTSTEYSIAFAGVGSGTAFIPAPAGALAFGGFGLLAARRRRG